MIFLKVKCPFCNSSEITYIRTLKSPINNKEYEHYYCKVCEIEFFYPLKFENIYEKESIKDYEFMHKGTRAIPPWTIEVINFVKEFNINLSGKKILDIGAGDGVNFIVLRRFFNVKPEQYYAIEIDRKSIETMRKRGIKNVINAFFGKEIINVMDGEFDIILATEVLEHQIAPREFLETAFSLLKDRGLIIITVPNRERFFIRYREAPTDLPPHHFLRFNKKFFQKNFSNNIIHLKEYKYKIPLLNRSRIISTKIIGKDSFWPIFIPLSSILNILDSIKGVGLIVAMKKGNNDGGK